MEDKRLEFWCGCVCWLCFNVWDNELRVFWDKRKDGLDGREFMLFNEVEVVLGDDNVEF